jgi:hypothetical protein
MRCRTALFQFHFFVRGCHTKHPTILFAGFTAFDTQTYSFLNEDKILTKPRPAGQVCLKASPNFEIGCLTKVKRKCGHNSLVT